MSEHKRSNIFSGSKGLYIALAFCLVAAGVIGYFTFRPLKTAQVVNPAPVIEEAPVTPKVTVPLPVQKPVTAPVEDVPTIAEPEELIPQVVSPLDGTTVTVFSMTELMYDETMADWRTHNGLDIQAGEGDAVKTAAPGTVASIRHDELMGTTVVIEHADGYTTTYASLQEEVPVAVGAAVESGDIIGYVGSTATAESSMGPHLHFSVAKNGEVIDPAKYVH